MNLGWAWIWKVLYWGLGWSALHATSEMILPTLLVLSGRRNLATQMRRCYSGLSSEKKAYWRRLVRSQFYYMLASATGIATLYGAYPIFDFVILRATKPDPVAALLGAWEPYMETLFAAAAAHWAVTFVEDAWCMNLIAVEMDSEFMADPESDQRALLYGVPEVVQQVKLVNQSNDGQWPAMRLVPVGSGRNASIMLYLAYQAHHAVTCGTYLFCLHTHRLSALGCFGLVFEAPVAILNLREFLVIFEGDLKHIAAPAHAGGIIINVWRLILPAVLSCRYNAIFIYIWSILFYRAELLQALDTDVLFWTYHILGIGFTALILQWSMLLRVWFGQDMMRIRLQIQQAEEYPQTEVDVEMAIVDGTPLMQRRVEGQLEE